MRWEKKNPSFTTIEQVIEYNSGTTVQELLFRRRMMKIHIYSVWISA